MSMLRLNAALFIISEVSCHMKHFLDTGQFEADELIGLIELAERLKFERKNKIAHPHLRARSVGLFCKIPVPVITSALRVGMLELGGQAVDLPYDPASGSIAGLTERLSGMFSGIAFCLHDRADIKKAASFSTVPIIDLADDTGAPVFVLSGLMTAKEFAGGLSGLKLCCINNDASRTDSLIYAAISCGMRVSIAAPIGSRPNDGIVSWGLRERKLEITSDPIKAAYGADIICGGMSALPVSHGQSLPPKQRNYCINDSVLASVGKNCLFPQALYYGPGDGISEETVNAHKQEALAAGENILHIVKAVLIKTIKL